MHRIAARAPFRTLARTPVRALHVSSRILQKNDTSTIDSFKLPTQTSINEWEFKYDFVPKMPKPKIPPISPEAVKQDIAHTKKQEVEVEMFAKELNSSIKVEANDADVVHGGDLVVDEVEFLHDRGLEPVDVSSKPEAASRKKTANTEKYVQTSINPEINHSDVVNLGHENEVDHKTTPISQARVVEDNEHTVTEEPKTDAPPRNDAGKILAVLGLGGIAGYFWFGQNKK